MFFLSLADNLFGRHHDPHVDDLVTVAGHHHADDILADVVDIALHCRQQYLTGTLATFFLIGFDIGLENTHRLLHRPGGLHHLRQEHLSLSETLTNGIHASHQGTFDDIHRMGILFQCLLQIHLQTLAIAFDQSLRQTLFDR